MKDLSRRTMLKLGTAGFAGSALPVLASANETACKASDGLCNAAVCIRAHQLLSLVCVLGGAQCPLIEAGRARELLRRLGSDPTTAIRLMSPADEVPHYTKLVQTERAAPDTQEVLNRKRDLDVLQRLGLAPGDTRRARYLYELLFRRIETLKGLCAYDTPGWEGCALAKSGAYERVRAKGWNAIVYLRSDQEREQYRRRNVQRIEKTTRLFVRPHHLMCLSCWYAGGKNKAPRPNDTLFEIWQRIRREPDVPITLVEGTCIACDCCDGFHPPNGRCVHPCGLIRDYKKDLDVLQRLGLMPGATMKARELFALLFQRIRSTREICAYGDGIERSEEWRICGGPDGNPGYAATRQTGIFNGVH
ncbi:MAG: hypothetical protein N2689_13230 [Verrucomicrobiae bacterium]|nr:hypothetical protein [Verrucomicrobiae bacterium]